MDVRLPEQAAKQVRIGRLRTSIRCAIIGHVTSVGRTTAGINKAEGWHNERPKQFRRYVAASLADDAGQTCPISGLDPPGDLVRPKVSNI